MEWNQFNQQCQIILGNAISDIFKTGEVFSVSISLTAMCDIGLKSSFLPSHVQDSMNTGLVSTLPNMNPVTFVNAVYS